MKRSNLSGKQIIAVLKEQQARIVMAVVCRSHGINSATIYKWMSKYGDSTLVEGVKCRVRLIASEKPYQI